MKAVDIELSRDEDSVQSLGNLSNKDGLIVFAGVNSSATEQNAGKNEHLRSFGVKYPPRKKLKAEEYKGEWRLLAKGSLFKPTKESKKETYQRLLRLSPSVKRESGCNRIGAIATGLSKAAEIVVFNATTSTPGSADVLTHIDLEEGTEANDLDIAESDIDSFSLAYCTDHDVHEQSYKYNFKNKKVEKTPRGPRKVYQLPFPDASEDPASKPRFRALRFFSSQNIVTLLNKPKKAGAELRIFHLYPTGPATMIQQKALPSHIKQAVSMDVTALDADSEGNRQFVIAVAGQNLSIVVFTTNFNAKTETFSPLRNYLTIRDAHKHQMTRVCLSPFHLPTTPPQQGKDKLTDSTPALPSRPTLQTIQLASVSMGNTVVVDTFPLQQLNTNDKRSRYVLSHPTDEAWARYSYLFVAATIGLVIAFLLQAFLYGFDSDRGPFSLILTPRMKRFLDRPAPELGMNGKLLLKNEDMASWGKSVPVPTPSILSSGSSRLQSLFSAASSTVSSAQSLSPSPAIVLRPDVGSTGVSIEQHVDKAAALVHDKDAKHWHELSHEQKKGWKEKLKHAGEWVESEGEGILQGILFSEYAGAVAQGAAEILREL